MSTRREVSTLVQARSAPLVGETRVLRALPRRELRRVGPMVFFDHFGPDGQPMQVPPHPHVGLQTVTYLFSGAIRHTDSLGSSQVIRPGDVNWMTAGRGIVHAEHGLDEGALHGVQIWVALPHDERDRAPAFEHVARESLPLVAAERAEVRIVAGAVEGVRAPVATFSPLLLVDVKLDANASIELPVDVAQELAVYPASGAVHVGDRRVESGWLASLTPGHRVALRAGEAGARVILFGGESMPEPTIVYWNFVVGSVDEGRAREADWEAGKFPAVPG